MTHSFQPRRSARTRITLLDAIVVVIAAALTTLVALRASYDIEVNYGVDYYHLWGVPAAHDIVDGNPYSRRQAYSEALNRVADADSDPHLYWSNHFRRSIQPTGTPFFYAVCGLLPRTFEVGYARWIVSLFVGVIAAMYGMARFWGWAPRPALAFASGVSLTFAPFNEDVLSGNVNSLQLPFLVAAITFARQRVDIGHRTSALAYAAALSAFVMFKPNMALVALFLAASFFALAARRMRVLAAAAAFASALCAFAIGAAYFRGIDAWSDWFAYVNGARGGTLLYRTEDGNISLAMMMSQRIGGMGPLGYGVVLGSVLLAACALALRRHGEGVLRHARARFEDPWFAAAAGILLTLFAAPLVWPHYLVSVLIPAAWAWGPHRGWDTARGLLVIGYALLALPYAFGEGPGPAKLSAFMLGWLPIAAAFVVRLAKWDYRASRAARPNW